MNSKDHTSSSVPAGRKPYTKPRLISYGHVKDVVQGGGGTKTNDGGAGGPSTKPCWIAEALYGVDAPRTLLLRAWLSEGYDQRRPWWLLVSLYLVFGRSIARLIQRGRIPARLFVPLFDRLVVKANDDTAPTVKYGGRTRVR
jgi:hypothetical protein